MASLKELIYNVRTIIKDRHSDDIKFTDRNIAFWIKYLRVKLIRQDYEKGRTISDNSSQELNVNFESQDIGSDKNIEVGQQVLKSTKKIPAPISAYDKDLITSITGNSTCINIVVQAKNKAIRNQNNKYGKKIPVAYLDQGYLYITGCNFYIENVRVFGVFEDPEEVAKFNSDTDLDYDTFLDQKFPIESHMIDMIDSLIKRNELDLYFQLSEDKVNDSQNNSL